MLANDLKREDHLRVFEQALVLFEQADNLNNLSFFNAAFNYAGLSETTDAREKAGRWLKMAIAKSHWWTRRGGFNHGGALTLRLLQLMDAESAITRLSILDQTLCVSIRSKKLRREYLLPLLEKRVELLTEAGEFEKAARFLKRHRKLLDV